jgi:transcriptional regulator with XRE-family HTH domain
MKKGIIKALRAELGMTQAEFAEQSGVGSYQQVSGIESGRRNLGLGLLTKIVNNLSANGHQVALDITLTVNDKKL